MIAAVLASTLLAGVVSGVTLEQRDLLSSQIPQAKITVSNTSSALIPYQYLAAAVFVSTPNGWQRQPSTWPFAFPPIMIAAHSSYTQEVRLPRCQAIESPCTHSVYVEYMIGTRASHVVLRSSILTYTIRPDPNETFDLLQVSPDSLSGEMSGIVDNRPVILTYGVASQEQPIDTLAIRFFLRPSVTSEVNFDFDAFRNKIVAALRARGFDASQADWSFGDPYWYEDVLVPDFVENATKVLAAISGVASAYATELQGTTHFLTFDFRAPAGVGLDNYFAVAGRNASAKATAFSQILGDQRLSYASTTVTVKPRADRFGRPYYPFGSPVDEVDQIDFGQYPLSWAPVSLADESLMAASTPIPVKRAPTVAALAARAFSRPQYAVADGFQPIAQIASDRPELYVVGTAESARARSIGLAPDFAALSDARRRAAQLALILGASQQYESLYALYPGDDKSYPMIGLATTLARTVPDTWMRLKPQPGTTAQSAPYDASMLATVPIFAPEAASLIQSHAKAQTIILPQHIRLDLYVEPGNFPAANGLRDVPALTLSLRRMEGVVSVAGGRLGTTTLGYEAVLFPAHEASIEHIMRAVEAAYRSQSVTVSANAVTLAAGCDAIETKLINESLYKNSIDSQRIALATGRPIHRLLLAAAIPMTVPNDGCRISAELPTYVGSLHHGVIPEIPAPLQLSVDTYLIFRTTSAAKGTHVP